MEKFLPEDSTSLMSLKKKTKVSSEVIESDKKRKKRDKSYKRFFPAIFTKENKNNNYEKVQLNECRQQDRYYTHFQRHDRLNKCSNSLYLKKDGNVNANVNSSLSGSIIEERINEIKHDLFPVQGNISISIPENFALQDNIRTRKLHSRKYAKFSNSYLDDCFNSLNIDIIDEENKYIVDGHISDSPDMRNLKHSKSQLDEKINECVLKRKYSFQESMISPFRQNCETFGRISTPPNERFFIRPRAIHPTDRPLPAVPQKIKPTNDYCNISHLNKPNNTVIDINKEKPNIRYASQEINTHASDRNTNRNLQSKTDTPNSLENSNRQLNYYQTETNFRCSSTTNSKFGDYADSSYIANSSHKSELSPNSSKSGEYYVLNSPYTNNQTSPNDSLADLHIEKISQHTIVKINKQESLYDKIPPVTQFAITLENDRQELLGHNESNKTELVYSETTSEKNSTLYNLNTSNQYDKNESKQQKREKSDLKRYNRQSEYNYNQNRNYLSSVKKQHYVNNDNLEIFHSTAENVLANNELYNDDYLDEKLIIPELQNSDKKSCHSQESQPNDQILITSPQKDETSIYNVHSSSKSESNHAFSSVSETKNIHTFINDSSTISLITCNSPDMLRIINRQQPESPCNNNYQRPEPIYIYSSSSKPSSLLLEKDKINYSDINELCKKKILVQIHSSESINQPKFLHPQIKNKQDSQRKEIYIEKTFQKQSESKKNSNLCTNSGQQFLSTQKIKLMQHLEAYYWHQKFIDSQRKSSIGMNTVDTQEHSSWKQIQSVNKDRLIAHHKECKKKILPPNQRIHCNRHLECGSISERERQVQVENFERQTVYQTGQKQPVLVVKPQQCVRNNFLLRTNIGTNTFDSQVLSRDPHNRSIKNSPLPLSVYNRNCQINNINNMISTDYGCTETKRVSFSNQSNVINLGPYQWPTKHGLESEPRTRKNKLMDSTLNYDSSLTNSLPFKNQELTKHNDYKTDRPYSPNQSSSTTWLPIKKYSVLKTRQKNNNYSIAQSSLQCQSSGDDANNKLLPRFSKSECGSEAGEMQIVQQRQNQEEWNSNSKNCYSNESGGTGKTESERSNNHGRRIGGVGIGNSSGTALGSHGRTGGVGGGRSRDEPRRHTLSGDHQSAGLLHHQQLNAVSGAFTGQTIHSLHPRHLPPPHNQYGSSSRHITMDLEMGTKSRQKKSSLSRGYPPPSSAMLFDDDPGIMSEVETSSTGFHRGGKQRSSLPVVRTPSKTLERPLGLVFLQYRNETKRALLPNEITSIDTVKALFVRSFPKQLTMEYLDSSHVKIYIHDSNKDMFYELEDFRSHLRDIRDRSVLRLFESDGVAGMPRNIGASDGPILPSHWEDPSYFSEPEFDSEFQHQHIHKSKSAKNSVASNGYYMSGSSTLPRGSALLRSYSPASTAPSGPNTAIVSGQSKTLGTTGGGAVQAPAKPVRNYHCGKSPLDNLGVSAQFSRDSSISLYSIPDRLHGESGYMSSPERGGAGGVVSVPLGSTSSNSGLGSATSNRYPSGPYSGSSSYEEPYYSQYSGTVTPVIDEEARIRVEHMERQLANLTGLVQKALTHAPHPNPSPRDYLQVPIGRDSYVRSADKSVSFEKSVSFSDEPRDMNSPKQHSPQHTADSKPTKPAIKSSTLPRMSSQERERHKPTPPPKPVSLAAGQYVYRDLSLTPEMYNQLRGLQKKAKDLRQEIRNLRRMSQAQAHTVRETIRDTFITIRATLLMSGEDLWATGDTEKLRLNREEDLYKQEMLWLEKDLTGLEGTVEELRGNVINRKTRVNMSDVENMALILSKASKTVADLKVRFPNLQEGMKGLLSSEMEKVMREEKFLKEEPDRLESALKRCKKLTGTLVTLKRLASVQEQRLPNSGSIDGEEATPITPASGQHTKATTPVPTERVTLGSTVVCGRSSESTESPYGPDSHPQRSENALDALLDELQTFSRPSSQLSQVPSINDIVQKISIEPNSTQQVLRRLHTCLANIKSEANGSITVMDESVTLPKPPLPERNAELLQIVNARRAPPPPPPRTSSRSPLASPTSPQLPPRAPLRRGLSFVKTSFESNTHSGPSIDSAPNSGPNPLSTSNSSSCESINSQEGLKSKRGRQEQLEQRHQELLRKQKALQEQYARLQQLQRNASSCATNTPPAPPDLLKKTGSESNLLAKMGLGLSAAASSESLSSLIAPTVETANNDKLYETDIL